MKTSECINSYAYDVNDFCDKKNYPDTFTKESCFHTYLSILDFDLMKE